MTTCKTCTHWRLKEAAAMAKHGMASCTHGPRYTYLPDHHTCPQHQPAPESITAARVQWLQRAESSSGQPRTGG